MMMMNDVDGDDKLMIATMTIFNIMDNDNTDDDDDELIIAVMMIFKIMITLLISSLIFIYLFRVIYFLFYVITLFFYLHVFLVCS